MYLILPSLRARAHEVSLTRCEGETYFLSSTMASIVFSMGVFLSTR